MFFNDSGYQQPLYQNDDNTDISAAVETPSGTPFLRTIHDAE